MAIDKYNKYLDKPEEVAEEEPYRPSDFLEPIMIKFAQLKVMTASRTDAEIAATLNIDNPSRVKKWAKNKHFVAFMNELKGKLVDQDIFERLKKQHVDLMDLTYTEAMTRFEDPFSEKNQEILNSLTDHSSKEKFLERFAYFSSHDKLMRTHNETAKALRVMMPQGMEAQTEIKLKETVITFRNQYEEGKKKRYEREQALLETGQDVESPFAHKTGSQKRKAEIVDAEIVPANIEKIEVAEWSVKTKRREKDE